MANILLVEDNTEMRLLLQEILEWGGHHVRCGRSGEDGLRTLTEAATPDLIISDLMMPGMDGFTFLQRVRQDARWAQVRFVMMSANPQDDRLQNPRQDGFDGVLPKPFSLEDLDALLA